MPRLLALTCSASRIARARMRADGCGQADRMHLLIYRTHGTYKTLQISRCSSFDTLRGRRISSSLYVLSLSLSNVEANLASTAASSKSVLKLRFNWSDGNTSRHLRDLSVVDEIWLQKAGWDQRWAGVF